MSSEAIFGVALVTSAADVEYLPNLQILQYRAVGGGGSTDHNNKTLCCVILQLNIKLLFFIITDGLGIV